ncbi:SpoIIE family protein phosphatase [Streptomyces sp. NPDC001970]
MASDSDLDPAAVRSLLDQTLAGMAVDLGAHAAALILLEPGGEVLTLDTSVGMPPEYVGPHHRVRVAAGASDPVMEAIHEQHLVWITSGEDLARRYPHRALVFPYPRAAAIAPIADGSTVWGALVLTLSCETSPGLDVRQRRRLATTARCIAWILQGAADAGQRLLPGSEPRFLPLTPAEPAVPAQAQAAVDFVAPLPEGGCRLDPRGRITFLDPTAADLLGDSIPRLVGVTLWEAVPWLDDLVCAHRHQAALAGQEPISYTAEQPPDSRQLMFSLYPDRTGVSVRITSTASIRRPGELSLVGVDAGAGPARLDALYHLMHLSSALAEAASVQEVVDHVAEHLLPALQAQAFALVLAEAGRVRIVGHHGFPPEQISAIDRVPLTATERAVPGLAAEVRTWPLTEGMPSFFADREELRAVYPEGAGIDDGLGAWAWLPLVVSGKHIGLCVIGYARPHTFTLEERTGLTSLGAVLAQALDRARQYDVNQHIAEGLQTALLPRTLPRLPSLDVAARYLPGSHGMDIGGDFYDLIRLSENEVAAVIGDVQGHNVTAAGFMGQVRTAIHAYAVAGAPPGEVLRHTNLLIADLDPDLLTSCLYAHIDLTDHGAQLATAGHCQPLLRCPDLHTRVLDVPPGPLLGADPHATYPTAQVALPPGSLLALYTDGLVEVPGTDYDVNLTELAAVLSRPTDSLEDLAATLLDHAQPSGDRTDDTAFLLLSMGAQA